ncbi:hypothetical protein ACOBQJ_11260 [Pelotomaculum propionicicum]|uniref:hypothetical protein n=1 Tax=Pelotomaculum propionicicum TaxID=258475 RepID=UPI003B76A7F1
MKIFLIIAGAVVFLAIVAFGIIGYFKSKKLFAEFTDKTTAKLPWNKAEILELNIEKLNTGAKYIITFADNGTETTHVAYEDNIKVFDDLRNNEKPYIKYKHLKNDVPFPKVRGWAVERGFYNIELHIEK